MWFKKRSEEREFLDETGIPVDDLYTNLRELDTINHHLGGYRASLKGLRNILKTSSNVTSLLDIGFGGGDTIKQFSGFAEKQRLPLYLYGVDCKTECLSYAKKNLLGLHNIQLICSDYRNIAPELLKKIEVIHCSLFLHHLKNEEIISLLSFCKDNNCIVLVNDLHRNWFAYYSIKFLTALFSKSWLVKNDAPLSVKRGFRKRELVEILEKAGFRNYSVKWSWAFRYIVIAKP